jgi:hypothetical protein
LLNGRRGSKRAENKWEFLACVDNDFIFLRM